jgi:guanine deaminase
MANTLTETERKFLLHAVDLSRIGMKGGSGGPFGCVIVKHNKIIGEGFNQVISLKDPTAHAEVVAIRTACKNLNDYQLKDCDIYSSCEPCPMCLGAIYWARPRRVIFANTRGEAAGISFDDDFIYKEISLPQADRRIPFIHVPLAEATQVFQEWKNMSDKKFY